MVRRLLSGWMLVMVLCLVGCRTDERQALIMNFVDVLKESKQQFSNLADNVDKAVKEAKEVTDDGMTVKKLDPASVEEIKEILKKSFKENIVKRCQNLEAAVQRYRRSSEADQKATAAAVSSSLSNAINDLNEEHKRLKESLDKAEKVDKETTQQLVQEIDAALGELVLMIQRKG